jgi:LEA14-like dessication related protein
MKRKLSLMAAVLICGLLCTTCSMLKGYLNSSVKQPKVTLKSVDFSSIDFTGLTLLSKVNVQNNTSISIPLPKIDWDLLVINNPFVKGTIQSKGSLKSQSATEMQFPVSFTYADLIKTISSLTDDNAKYKMKMVAHIPVPKLGDMSWPLEFEGKIPLMRIPNISMATAPSATLSSTGGNVSFALNVKNNSNIAVAINELSCNLKINNTSLSKGGVTGKPRINPGATEKITIQIPLSISDITSVGANVLRGNFNYNLTGNYKFGIPDFPLLNEVGDSFSLRK